MSSTSTRPTGRLLLGAMVAPVVSTAAALWLLLSWRSELPAEVAIHWGPGGEPDNFVSVTALGWLVALAGVLGLALAVLTAWANSPALARTLSGTTGGTVGLLHAMVLSSTAAHLGPVDPTTVRMEGWWLAVGLGASAVGAVVAVLLVPRWQGDTVAPGRAVTALDLADGERAVWTSSVSSGHLGTAVAALGVASTLVAALVTGTWWMLVVPAVLAVTMWAMLSVRVTVDATGLRVRGRLGWPRAHLPIEQITSVSVVDVKVMRDFGGFGYRFAATGRYKGARGFVLRSGEAILATTADGRSEITVVEDARTGAALLEAYRTRNAA